MSNYTSSAHGQWVHHQPSYSQDSMNQEEEYIYNPQGPVQQSQPQQFTQQPYLDPNGFQFPSMPHRIPSNTPASTQQSSLSGAFNLNVTQPSSHSRNSSFGSTQGAVYAQGGFPAQPAPSFSPNQTPQFNFSTNGAVAGGNGQAFASPPSSATQRQTPQLQGYYRQENPAKRKHAMPAPAYVEDYDDEFDGDEGHSDARDTKDLNKQSRACARCKGLKVKCENKTETEPCRRCLNGGWPCTTPDKKVRRIPPKREALMQRISEQASEIAGLMKKLEKLNADSSKNPGKLDTGLASNLPSVPTLSPSTAAPYGPGNSITGDSSPGKNAEIEAWLAKARESFQEFGSFIGIGGAGAPTRFVVGEDPEADSSSDDEFADASSHFELDIRDPENRQTSLEPGYGLLNHKISASSLSAANSGTTSRKRENRRVDLPSQAAPFGMFEDMTRLSLRSPRPISREVSAEPEEEENGAGIANENYFSSTPTPNAVGERLEKVGLQGSNILTRGIITPEQAEQLFELYFDRMNLSLSLLDPVLYTAKRTFYRSPFLFTVICAIASRHYLSQAQYLTLMHHAQLAAGTALISGTKNVEMCSAYILLSLYPLPVKRWEDQRSWLYLGLAIRTATDLNLHIPTTAKPLNENHAREMLNRTRVWLNCLNLDRSTGSQYGKPPIISPRDYIANHSENWWQSSPYNMKHFDIHLCAYSSELSVMSAFIAKIYSDPDHPTGLNKTVNFEEISVATDDQLKALGNKWFTLLEQTDQTDSQNVFRTGLLRLAYSYARLVALSYGFQHAFGKNDDADENPFLIRCLTAASDVVNAVVDDICRPSQIRYFRCGPEAQSVFVTFASAFLVKLLQPKFASYLSFDTRVQIRALVQKVVDLLGSPEVAIDDRHGPKLYSKFLEKLLARPMAQLHPVSPGIGSAPPPKSKSRRQKNLNLQDGGVYNPPLAFDLPTSASNHPSPTTTSSLSPPPTEQALSFDHFAPVGGFDPYGPSGALNTANVANLDMSMDLSEYFQPTLPFDNDILQSVQSLSDPSGWQDMTMPVAFNWMAQFQQNLGLDLSNPATFGDPTPHHYMTEPTRER